MQILVRLDAVTGFSNAARGRLPNDFIGALLRQLPSHELTCGSASSSLGDLLQGRARDNPLWLGGLSASPVNSALP